MTFTEDQRRAAGVFLVRLLLGLIFLMQGYGKVFQWGLDGVYQNAFSGFEETWIPIFLLKGVAYFTSYVELIGGALLVIGLFRQWSYLALGLVLVLVTYGHGLESPIWDLQHVFFRASMLTTLLLLPSSWDRWTLDSLISKDRKSI